MPRRDDLKKILIIGSGPIVIGQACEFDYSGTQACKALREEGYEVVLVNSNPATIMTDPATADRTYIEPLTWQIVAKVIEKERPDALLPTLGGQTGLNVAMDLARHGVLEKFGVEMIGANADVIDKAESRQRFQQAMNNIGLDVASGRTIESVLAAREWLKEIGLPAVLRPSFTMGGSGSGIVFEDADFDRLVAWGLELSPVHQILIEESIIGWKEYEMEVMRDKDDNVVIICSIENFDPMGIHTGDSITVAPAQTLTDKEYQRMRDASLAVIREIGVDTGGSNIQFALNPRDGRMLVIEMTPRVSRSSALASKATGFPIAKIAAKLAVGYTLDEIPNDITKMTPACFEPTIDYVVAKIPKWQFEKFPGADEGLGPQMKSVGEAMAIGRTFKEALMKGIRSLETGKKVGAEKIEPRILTQRLVTPHPERLTYIRYALHQGMTVKELNKMTSIDPWFLYQLKEIAAMETELVKLSPDSLTKETLDNADRLGLEITPTEAEQLNGSPQLTKEKLRQAKRLGISDERIALSIKTGVQTVRRMRETLGIRPVYKLVDTCAAEFESYTPYLYSTYEEEDEAPPTDKKKILILGSGPNRIGQGIEFDYCCCHAAFALHDDG